jgi:6-phosphogluconolactonase
LPTSPKLIPQIDSQRKERGIVQFGSALRMFLTGAFPVRRIVSLLLIALVLPLAGCNGFFFKETASGGGTGTGATNYAFVANAGANTVAGLGISATGTLAALTGSPITLNTTPTALAVSRNNTFLWVGTVSQIFGYSIASDGTLAALNSGNAIANAFCVDMQTSPDGKWLMVLDGSGNSVDLFGINSDGTLSPNSGIGFTASGTVVPKQLRIANSGAFVVAAMGTAGELVFSFNTTTGAFAYLAQTTPPNLTSDNGIAIDSTGTYLYEARSGNGAGLVVNTIASNGTLTPTTNTPYATGTQPYSVVLDNTGKYVYVANRTDGTISGYTIGTGAALAAISGTPFSSGVAVTALGADSTGKWLLAAAFSGSPDLTLYGFDATNLGRLYSVSSSATGTNAYLLALSH